MRVSKWVAGSLALCTTAALAADSVTMVEGRWKEVMTLRAMTMGGKPMDVDSNPGKVDIAYRCVSKAEAADPASLFRSHKPEDNCAAPQGEAGSGKLALTSTCKGELGPIELNVSGTYGAQRYDGKVLGKMEMRGEPITIESTIEGTYEGPCKGDERS
jgi:hypothetical protein